MIHVRSKTYVTSERGRVTQVSIYVDEVMEQPDCRLTFETIRSGRKRWVVDWHNLWIRT